MTNKDSSYSTKSSLTLNPKLILYFKEVQTKYKIFYYDPKVYRYKF